MNTILCVVTRWAAVALLTGCASPSLSGLSFAAPTPTVPPLTSEAFLEQFCAGVEEYEVRHRKWHATSGNPQEAHWGPSFVPMVQDPMLKHFENPPTADRAEVAAMRLAFETASEKFTESARRWAAGDEAGTMNAENEAFKYIFGEFPERARKYFKKYGTYCVGLG